MNRGCVMPKSTCMQLDEVDSAAPPELMDSDTTTENLTIKRRPAVSLSRRIVRRWTLEFRGLLMLGAWNGRGEEKYS